EVQLVAHDVKQHILSRGSRIKQMQPPAPPPQAKLEPAPPPKVVPLAAPPPVERRHIEQVPVEPVGQALYQDTPHQHETAEPQKKRRPAWAFAAGVVLALIAIAVLVNMA